MLNNIPFAVKDWAMWIIMWLAVGFFVALQMGNAYASCYGQEGLAYFDCEDAERLAEKHHREQMDALRDIEEQQRDNANRQCFVNRDFFGHVTVNCY